MPITLNGDSGITTPTYNGADTSEYIVPVTAFKNRIINGAMMIDQRNAGASVTVTSDGQYTVDRWQIPSASASKVSVQRNAGSVTPPAGFSYYLGVTSLAATTIGTSDYWTIRQNIEGFNWADLAFGTSSASTVTLSFWVRSSLTGTFAGALQNNDETRSYVFNYTISSANTWEYKTVTITGSTDGTWVGATNGIGARLVFNLGAGTTPQGTVNAWNNSWKISSAGTVNLVSTNGATFYITGVQLEKGSTATSFDYRPYGTELQLCQRYFLLLGGVSTNDNVGAGQAFSTTSGGYSVRFPVPMRATPTLDTFTASNWSVLNGTGGLVAATAISFSGGQTSTLGCQISATVASGLTAGQGSQLLANTVNARLPFNSEL